MKAVLVSLIIFLSSCASLEDHLYEAERHCHHIFNTKNLNLSDSKNNKWDRRQFTQCVAYQANASANQSQANAAWASVIIGWVSIGLTVLIGIARR